MKKIELRQSFLEKRLALNKDEIENFSNLLSQKLYNYINKKNYKTIHCFLPIKNEVNLIPFIEKCLADKRDIYIPKVLDKINLSHHQLLNFADLQIGKFGTSEINSKPVDIDYNCVIVPGLVFSLNKQRIGYGKGYYDRFLKDQKNAEKIAVAYPFQVIDFIEAELHDSEIDTIITI